jgi:hypothetical protein
MKTLKITESNARFNPDDYECLAGVCPDLSDEEHCENCSLKRLKKMTEEKLGQEPAFPCEVGMENGKMVQGHQNGSNTYIDNGISKRFYAVCTAMQGMLAHSTRYHCRPEDSHLTWKQGMIKEAYELADELLRQEEK